jgi:ADP-ribose pyrophosphatase YjhB (NUDIX family)
MLEESFRQNIRPTSLIMSPDTPRLDVHHFCPRCGAAPLELHPPHLTVCPRCGLNLYHNACAATAAILLDAQDRVLLIRRARDPAKGKLAFPGGFVDNGESAEAGLRRELREEIGLDVGALEYLVSHPNTYPYGGVRYDTLDFFFVARVQDFAAARPLDAVTEIVIQPTASVRADELAFVSMQAAWRAFRARHQAS